MPCWSCQAETPPDPLCPACGALQPVPAGLDMFAALGLPRTWFLSAEQVEEAFKRLNRKLHPDRFAQRSARERRHSLEWTTAVNDACRTLKDPLSRAAYWLGLNGLDVEREASGPAGLPVELLEEVMEQREALAQARRARDLGAVRALSEKARARAAEVLEELSARLREWEQSGREQALRAAVQPVAALRYYRRFQEEADAAELEALEA